MGEVAAGRGRAGEWRKAGAAGAEHGGGGGVRCEVLMPQVYVRVLLVEGDDATRHIIAALLRKCSYKVAAAADGLKAWDTLKEKSHNIDLVLTEVELPSISGYGLLTMIMEHEACKNIPVIMMSSHDSVNTVFKCLLKGAADFLIKPIRKNELRNLWQHVWRRHSSVGLPRGTYKHQDENLTQGKWEPNSERNTASNHYRDCIVSLPTGKGCDTQTSCTRPDMDAESEHTQNMENIHSDCISSSVVNDIRNHEDYVCDKLAEKLPMHESETEGCTEDANVQHEEKNQNICQSKPSREVDLIGTMDKHSCSNHGLKNCSELQGDISNDAEILDDAKDKKFQPVLELTLRRHQSISADNQENNEFNMLNHSNSSAFSRYNMTVPSPLSTPNGFRTELGPSRDQGVLHSNTSQCSCAPLNMYLGAADSPIGGPLNQCGRDSCSHLGLLPIPVPMSGTAYGPFPSYSPVIPPLFYTQSATPAWCLKPTNHEATHAILLHQSDQETFNSGQQDGDPDGQNVHKDFYQMQKEHTCNIESFKERSHVASVTSQSSCICNPSISHANSSGCGSICDGSNGNLTATNVSRSSLESADGNGLFIHDEIEQADSHRSVLREAALIKFRLKRKERCYEKKVHYQSRKRLAEERPRVKGQFVRRVQHDHGPMEADSYPAVDNCLPVQM